MRASREGMQCAGCFLAPSRWSYRAGSYGQDRAVFGAGSVARRLAFVAEAPGDTEVRLHEPLVGPTGWWFKNLLADAGIPFEEVYRTNALLCQAPGKGSELKGAAWTAINNCRPSLLHECADLVRNYGVRVFVALGAAALKALLPECPFPLAGAKGKAAARGYVFPLRDLPYGPADDLAYVVPTLHPSPKNLKGKKSSWPIVVNDIRKAAHLAMHGLPPARFERVPATVPNILSFLMLARPLVIDVENTGDGRLVDLGACDGTRTLVTPWLAPGGTPYWSASDAIVVRDAWSRVLADPAWPKINQNVVHDDMILRLNGMPVRGWVHDTMLSHAACWPDQLHSLHHLGSLYRVGPPWKPAEKWQAEGSEPEVTR